VGGDVVTLPTGDCPGAKFHDIVGARFAPVTVTVCMTIADEAPDESNACAVNVTVRRSGIGGRILRIAVPAIAAVAKANGCPFFQMLTAVKLPSPSCPCADTV